MSFLSVSALQSSHILMLLFISLDLNFKTAQNGSEGSRQHRTTHHYLNQLFIHMTKVLLSLLDLKERAKFFGETRKIVLPFKFASYKFSISSKKIQEVPFRQRQPKTIFLFILDFKFTK